MKFVNFTFLALLLFSQCTSISQETQNSDTMTAISNFYDLNVASLDEQSTINMADFKGKKVLIVNVASRCGFTPQYEGLQKLNEEYGEKVQIIGFPCNQFLFQEPAGKDSIAKFCSLEYGVTFPISTKIKVKGSDKHPVYKWLTSKELNGNSDNDVSWNFNKFLIDEEGNLQSYFGSNTKPYDAELIDAINN